jgi:hypothetical protein
MKGRFKSNCNLGDQIRNNAKGEANGKYGGE